MSCRSSSGRIAPRLLDDGHLVVGSSVDGVVQTEHGGAEHAAHRVGPPGPTGAPARVSSVSVASSHASHCSSVQSSGSAAARSGRPSLTDPWSPPYRDPLPPDRSCVVRCLRRRPTVGRFGPDRSRTTAPVPAPARRSLPLPSARRRQADSARTTTSRRGSPVRAADPGGVGLLDLHPPGADLHPDGDPFHLDLVHGPASPATAPARWPAPRECRSRPADA